jgi:regulatory protein
MLITKVQKSRRERNRYDVYFDDQKSLRVSESVRTKFGLFTGVQIDDETLDNLRAADERERAHQIAVNFISYRPRSSREVLDRLTKKGFDPSLSSELVERLRELNLLNDIEFARMFVRDRLLRKPMGRALLRKKLMEKGISFQMCESVIKEYVTDRDEEVAAKNLLTRKLKMSQARYSKLDPVTRQKRLMDYLLQRGFSHEVASKTARSLTR